MNRVIPWTACVLLLLALGGVYFSDRRNYDAKVAELAIVEQRLATVTAEADARLRAASLPEATAIVDFRKALLSSGSVAVIRNTSDGSSPFSLQVERPSTSKQQRFETVIDGSGSKEVGEGQGWAFVPGDRITVGQPGHKPLTFTLK